MNRKYKVKLPVRAIFASVQIIILYNIYRNYQLVTSYHAGTIP